MEPDEDPFSPIALTRQQLEALFRMDDPPEDDVVVVDLTDELEARCARYEAALKEIAWTPGPHYAASTKRAVELARKALEAGAAS